MKFTRYLCLAILFASPASGQLTLTDHQIGGYWEFADTDEYFGDNFFESSVAGYEINVESMLTEELFPGFDQSATLTQRYTSEAIQDGFRNTGYALATNPAVPFYEHSMNMFSSVSFSLAEPVQLRVSGFLRHDPLVDEQLGTVVLLNGTDFNVTSTDSFVGAFNSFKGDVAFDIVADFDAGDHVFSLVNYSTWVGRDGSGLLGVDTAWDITVQIIPASATFLLAPAGLVLASRRRR